MPPQSVGKPRLMSFHDTLFIFYLQFKCQPEKIEEVVIS